MRNPRIFLGPMISGIPQTFLHAQLPGMKWLVAVCSHDVAVRPTERGPEWFCRECDWALPLFRDRCDAMRAVNSALVRATGFAGDD